MKNNKKATLLNSKNEISAEKYFNINLIDFIYESIEYSKTNDMSLKESLIDLICEHIDKMIINAEDFDKSVTNQDLNVLNLFLDAHLFTTEEITTKKAINKTEIRIIYNVANIIKKRIKNAEKQNRMYLFSK